MEFINKKRIPEQAVSVILYFSLACSCWYYMRQLMAYFSITYFNGTAALYIGNAVVGALLGGFVLYIVINSLITRALHPYRLFGVNNDMLKYVFKLSLSVYGLVYGGLSFIYFATPLIALYGDFILRFIVMTAAVSVGFIYCVKNGFVPKEIIGRTLYASFFSYFVAYAAIVSLKLLLYYMMGVI